MYACTLNILRPFVRSGFTTCMVPKLLTEKGNYTWSDFFAEGYIAAKPYCWIINNKQVCRIYSYHGDN